MWQLTLFHTWVAVKILVNVSFPLSIIGFSNTLAYSSFAYSFLTWIPNDRRQREVTSSLCFNSSNAWIIEWSCFFCVSDSWSKSCNRWRLASWGAEALSGISYVSYPLSASTVHISRERIVWILFCLWTNSFHTERRNWNWLERSSCENNKLSPKSKGINKPCLFSDITAFYCNISPHHLLEEYLCELLAYQFAFLLFLWMPSSAFDEDGLLLDHVLIFTLSTLIKESLHFSVFFQWNTHLRWLEITFKEVIYSLISSSRTGRNFWNWL